MDLDAEEVESSLRRVSTRFLLLHANHLRFHLESFPSTICFNVLPYPPLLFLYNHPSLVAYADVDCVAAIGGLLSPVRAYLCFTPYVPGCRPLVCEEGRRNERNVEEDSHLCTTNEHLMQCVDE